MKTLRTLFVVFFLTTHISICFAQGEDVCGIIEAVFKQKQILKYLSIYNLKPLDEYGTLTIVLVDTLNYFSNCTQVSVNGHPLIIADKCHKNPIGDRYVSKTGKNIMAYQTLIDIFSLKKVQKFYVLNFGRVENGLYGHIILKRKKHRFVIISMQLGQT
jgi:hypothetical protein